MDVSAEAVLVGGLIIYACLHLIEQLTRAFGDDDERH